MTEQMEDVEFNNVSEIDILKKRNDELNETLKTKESEIQKLMETNNELISELENNNQKHVELAENKKLNEEISELSIDYNKLWQENQNLENYNQKLLREKTELKNDYDALWDTKTTLMEEKKVLEKENSKCKMLQKSKEALEKQLRDLNKNLNDYKKHTNNLEQSITQLKEERDNYLAKLTNLSNMYGQKERQIKELKDEASKYQLALGNATTFRLNDDDKNNTVQLNVDIESLQDKISDYVTHLKGSINLDYGAINRLLERYGSKTQINHQTPNKPLIKAVLQRHVLEKILNFANEYFNKNEIDTSTYCLESEIVYKTKDLIESVNRLSYERFGSDHVTQAAPIKLRQQIYAVLGHRGFSDTHENGLHPFLKQCQNALNHSINRYRSFKDPDKTTSIEEKAVELVSDVIRLFYFRFKVQEPIIHYYWFKYGEKVHKIYMNAQCEEDVDDVLVDICSFPLIGKDLNDPSKRKIFTQAKVYSRVEPKKQTLATIIKNKVCNAIIGEPPKAMNNGQQFQDTSTQTKHDHKKAKLEADYPASSITETEVTEVPSKTEGTNTESSKIEASASSKLGLPKTDDTSINDKDKNSSNDSSKTNNNDETKVNKTNGSPDNYSETGKTVDSSKSDITNDSSKTNKTNDSSETNKTNVSSKPGNDDSSEINKTDDSSETNKTNVSSKPGNDDSSETNKTDVSSETNKNDDSSETDKTDDSSNTNKTDDSSSKLGNDDSSKTEDSSETNKTEDSSETNKTEDSSETNKTEDSSETDKSNDSFEPDKIGAFSKINDVSSTDETNNSSKNNNDKNDNSPDNKI
ncbi:5998_t:CDS:1 [Scutellospora calospora]|uniref:5998_t:CDS:1 n=1 Tax=Scutellospora calospora TaxID=85575 RepID=A0ACA9KZ31_9GLOM|nr:5998_t:CDS:1 [Scutellospora calospora]